MERIELSGLKSLKLIIKPGGQKEGVFVFVSRTITYGSMFSLKEPMEAGDRAVEGNVDGVSDSEKVDSREVRLLTVGDER